MTTKMRIFEVFFILFIQIFSLSTADSQCRVNVKTGMDKDYAPMVLKPTGPAAYVYPNLTDPSSLVFARGDDATIFCPGKSNGKSTKVTQPGRILIDGRESNPRKNLATIKCIGEDQFRFASGEVATFERISCLEKRRASHGAIMIDPRRKCSKGDRYEIGYDVGGLGFLRNIDLCHDEKRARTLWAHGVILPVNQDSNRYNGPHKSFKTGSLYEGMAMSMEEPYNLNKAFETLASLLGSRDAAMKYLSPKTSDRKFLAKGHLIANADMFHKSEQESTYFYANAVPMWQRINANPGNWFFVEEYVRRLANVRGHELDVYVGGVGVLTLDRREFSLYRKVSETTGEIEEKIPVPKVLFKCAVDRADEEALCFLVVNDPYVSRAHLEKAKNRYIVCKRDPRCEKLTEQHDDTSLGYLYCCSLRDFYGKNARELGLEDVKPFLKFKPMQLLS